MQLQPKNDEFNGSINKIKEKIKLLKSNLASDGKYAVKKDDRPAQLEVLNTEYEKLAQLRLDQCQSLKNQWETYRNEQRQYRKKDIEKRQIEFDKELDSLDSDRRDTWKDSEELSIKRKNEICNELLKALRNCCIEDDDNNDDNTIDTTIVTLPTELLELFWLMEIDIPIMKSEIPNTIHLIENRKI